MKNTALLTLAALFVTVLIVSNIVAVKIGSFFGLMLPTAVILFPLGYILGDIITEVYGFAATRRIIWLGFACNLLAVAAITGAIAIPAAPFFERSDAFTTILGGTPRILGASFVAYLVGEFVNATILAKLKIKTAGRHLWLRTISSTAVGEGLDSAIFLSLAFWGTFPPAVLGGMIVTQWLFKTGFEVLATPFLYPIVAWLKRRDGVDAYDTHTSFNPLKIAAN